MLGELTVDIKGLFNSHNSGRKHARVGPALIFPVLCNQGFHQRPAKQILISVNSRSPLR